MKLIMFTRDKILLFLGFLMVSLFCPAQQKEYKDLKTYIKESNVSKGRELVTKCLNDTLFNNNPKFYALAAAIEAKANDAENMKLYLHQKYDTAGFFNSIYKIFEYTLKQEELLRNQIPKRATKVMKKNHEMLRLYYPNLYSGGVFFVKSKEWKSAHQMFSTYIEVSQSEYFKNDKYITTTRLPRAAFWSMVSCYESKEYNEVFRYRELAECDSANFDFALQYESLTYAQLADTTKYINSLLRGLQKSSFSEFSDYFFSRLTDILNDTHQYQKALALNDSLLAISPNKELYLYGQTVVLFNLKMYDKCLETAQKLLAVNKDNIQGTYYVGLCLYNKGVSYEVTISPNPTSEEYKKRSEEVNQLYQAALPYLEKFKAAFPDNKEKWLTPLYKIYFNLNMSEKLKELE